MGDWLTNETYLDMFTHKKDKNSYDKKISQWSLIITSLYFTTTHDTNLTHNLTITLVSTLKQMCPFSYINSEIATSF